MQLQDSKYSAQLT